MQLDSRKRHHRKVPGPGQSNAVTKTVTDKRSDGFLKKNGPLLDFPEPEDDSPLLDFSDVPSETIPGRSYNPKGCDKTEYKRLKQSCVDTFTRPNITARMKFDIQWQNRHLLQKFTENAIEPYNFTETDLKPVAGFSFLNISTAIYKKLCPNEFVPHNFITNMEFLFKVLHNITTSSSPRTELISTRDKERTEATLLLCLNDTVNQTYFGDECGEVCFLIVAYTYVGLTSCAFCVFTVVLNY